MSPLLLEMSIVCVRTECYIGLVSYGSKHAWESLFNKPFSHTCTHNLKTTGHVWMFCVSDDWSMIEDILCVLYSCMRDLTGKVAPSTHQSFSDTTLCAYTANPYIH